MLAIRNYAEGDLPTLLDFVVPQPGGGSEPNPDSAAHRSVFTDIMRLPGRNQEKDCLLLCEDNSDGKATIRGFCLVFPEPPGKDSPGGRCVLNIHVAPGDEYEPGWRGLLRAGLRRTQETGSAVAHIALWPPYDRAADLLDEGFEMARVYWNMTWEGDLVSDVELPDTYRVRSFTEDDAAALTATHNDAFAGTWWFASYTEAQTAHRARMANTSHDGIKLLFQGEQLAGYCWTLLMSDGRRQQGVIGSIGLAPEFRGGGISRLILAAGMRYLRSAGADYIRLEVDGNNAPAIRLYQSMGFQKAGELHWYEHRFEADVASAE